MCSKSYNAKAEKEGEIEMNSVTVKDLMQDQEARLKKMRQQEKEYNVSEIAKCLFRQPPYYMTERCRELLGGIEHESI